MASPGEMILKSQTIYLFHRRASVHFIRTEACISRQNDFGRPLGKRAGSLALSLFFVAIFSATAWGQEGLEGSDSATDSVEAVHPASPVSASSADNPDEVKGPPKPPSEDAIEILGTFVEPGQVSRLVLQSSESFAGVTLETPVVVVNGVENGESLCIVAGIHGDEVNGVEVVRRVLLHLDPKDLKGSVIAIPIANPSAFLRGSRYLLDRRDLNRYFPGRPKGSSASRIAHNLFENVIRNCDALVDLHTGSFKRTNFAQLRANLSHEETAVLAAQYGGAVVINSMGRVGTLRRAVTETGIPAITVEFGDNASNEHIRRVSKVAAEEMMKRLLDEVDP